MVGFVLADKYRILRQIGRGGMGVVYEAEHVELGKRVAVKLMLDKYAEDNEAAARFRREAQAAGRIGNPHIIDVSDVGTTHDGRPFVVMELLNGLTLSKVIEMTGSLPPWRAIAIMRQVLRAVGAAHARGIIHRDLKPDNIFLIQQGEHQDFVKLLDFGISKVVDPDEQVAMTKLTTTGVVMGTPLYMAPEQAMGQPIERFADIYACGVILYEMLAGRPPFEGQTYAVLVAKLLTQDAPLLSDVRPGLPGGLVHAVHRALEKEPRDRFQTAEQFLLALPGEKTPSLIELESTLHDSGSGAVAVSPPTEKRAPRKWPLFVLLAAILAGAGVATFFVINNQESPDPEVAAQRPPTLPSGGSVTVPPPPPVAPMPAPVVGYLQVRSNPLGAMVSIDGIEKGPTPIEITLEPGRGSCEGGKYKVRVELDGYVTSEAEEDVRAKERSSVVMQLVKDRSAKKSSRPPAVKAKSDPPKSDLSIEPKPVDPFPDVKPEPKKPPKKSSSGAKENPYD